MKAVSRKVLDLPLEQRAMMALRDGVRKAIAERRQMGLPVYVWLGGRVTDISSDRRPASRTFDKGDRSKAKRR